MITKYNVTCATLSEGEIFNCDHNHDNLEIAMQCLNTAKRSKKYKCQRCGHEWIAASGDKCKKKGCKAGNSLLSKNSMFKHYDCLTIKAVDDGQQRCLNSEEYAKMASLLHGLPFRG